MRQVYPKLAVLLTAVCFGILEGGGHVQWGPPNFGPFIANWHIPMAVLMLSVLYLAHQFRMIAVWVMLEDMTYWVCGHALTPTEWINFGMGGFTLFDVYLPNIYIALFVLWLACEYLVRVFNFKFELNLT